MRVFVTDGHYKHALTIVRSLGSKGIVVDAGSTTRYAVSFYSKYVHSKYLYPDPKGHPSRFFNFLDEVIKKQHYDVLLPVGYYTTLATARFKDQFHEHVAIPVAGYDWLRLAANKAKTLELAREMGIPAPKTIICKNSESVKEAVRELEFPVVIKSALETGTTRYARGLNELIQKCKLLPNSSKRAFIIQEYIPGEGYGFFALFNQGKLRAMFMHKRIREYPASGGPSTSAEGIYEPELKELGIKLLESLTWHGVAMVEFRKDFRDNEYKLMEINPKFWGSLDLAIASQVDFPYLVCKMALDGDIRPVLNYKIGVKFTWPFPDDFQRIFENPTFIGGFIKDLIDPRVKKNISWKDLNPNLVQLVKSLVIAKRLLKIKSGG